MSSLNVVVINDYWTHSIEKILFGEDPITYLCEEDFDLFDLLMKIGAFSSKSQARKSQYAGLKKQPPGFNDLTVGKKGFRLATWLPVDDVANYDL